MADKITYEVAQNYLRILEHHYEQLKNSHQENIIKFIREELYRIQDLDEDAAGDEYFGSGK